MGEFEGLYFLQGSGGCRLVFDKQFSMQIFLALFTIPISTFLNMQSMTVPLANRIDTLPSAILNASQPLESHSVVVIVFSVLSLIAGGAANISLIVRMLERKIKWSTRIAILCLFLQAVLALFTLALFHTVDRTNEHKYTEAVVYKILSTVASIGAGVSLLIKYISNGRRNQVYVWLLYDLSNEQRQFIILTVCSMTYLTICSFIYAELENWAFELSLYWAISTFLTIGFGDVVPESTWGLILFPFITSLGVLLVGSTIYAMRNVYLESLAIRLASNYSKFIIVHGRDGELHTPPSTFSSNVTQALDIEAHTNRRRTFTEPQMRLGVSLESQVLPPPMMDPIEANEVAALSIPRNRKVSRLATFDATVPLEHDQRRKTLKITRSKRLPAVTIVGHHSLSESLVAKATSEEIVKQACWALLSVLVNVAAASGIFALLERWSFWRGCYFTYLSFMTIGYGDVVLKNYVSRSIFIWYIFFAIGSWTYLFSMISELAFDEWSIETESIAKRIDRYEVKAKWKQMYSPLVTCQKGPRNGEGSVAASTSFPLDRKGKEIDIDDDDQQVLTRQLSADPLEMEIDHAEQKQASTALPISDRRRPSLSEGRGKLKRLASSGAYSISISMSREPSFLLKRVKQRIQDHCRDDEDGGLGRSDNDDDGNEDADEDLEREPLL